MVSKSEIAAYLQVILDGFDSVRCDLFKEKSINYALLRLENLEKTTKHVLTEVTNDLHKEIPG